MFNFEQLAELDGLISREVGELLHNFAALVPQDQAIVELGSYRGKSTCYLATGAALDYGAPVFAVDAWSEDVSVWRERAMDRLPSPEYDDFTAQLATAGVSDLVTPIRGLTVDTAAGWKSRTKGRRIGLLYIDGDHHHEAVIADFRAWHPHLAPDATVIFDDYDTPTNPGVLSGVQELVRNGELIDVEKHAGRLAVARPGRRHMRLSGAIMAHPVRTAHAEALREALDRPVPIVYDENPKPSTDPRQRWKVGRECWASYDADADWHIVIQDDAVPCADMLAGLEHALHVIGPEGFVSAFTGWGKPTHHHVRKGIRHAQSKGHAWMPMRSLAWGVAVALPTAAIGDMLEWCSADERADLNYDKRIGIYVRDVLKWRTWYTIPSLVNHKDLPSLVGHGGDNRGAFQHHQGSALDIDWRRTPPGGLRIGQRQ